ncbi:thiolase [Terfezia boudieri ATCC MYA-4762]|uniref:acetyl-CoA C-acetyltransferase n=1 Tax=Terfezia boudieri ATCC MYA-4762 TaxID=1051890 RepID=A0A3N4LNQ5_9PEZI|nr:thiolase [Terfezia boudieri ATCC MYA-4762]
MLSSRVSVRGLQCLKHFRNFSSTPRAQLEDVYIVGAARTATAKFLGSFKDTPAPVLASHAIRAALTRSSLPQSLPTHVYLGNVLSAGLGQSPARQATIFSGLPETCEATTINKVCASGLKSVSLAAAEIQLGHTSCAIGGGMENMSLVPRYLSRSPPGYGHIQAEDGVVKDGLWDVYNSVAMGNCAENTAKKLNITRQDQDEYTVESYRRAKAAWDAGLFEEEIAAVEIPQRKGPAVVVKEDEEYNAINVSKIATLKPVFIKDGGTITAANASTLSDGASAVVLSSKSLVEERSLQKTRVFARIVSTADAATHPIDFPLAPTLAIPLALKRAGLEITDIARFEINEAFAAVSVANEKVLGLDRSKVNVNGGAVALGHALGSSGSRILVSLLYGLREGEFGVAGICNGGGGATAMVVQKL